MLADGGVYLYKQVWGHLPWHRPKMEQLLATPALQEGVAPVRPPRDCCSAALAKLRAGPACCHAHTEKDQAARPVVSA